MDDIELKTQHSSHPPVRDDASNSGESEGSPGPRAQKDRLDLIRVGKKPVLLRNFGFMSILGFSCLATITWEGALISMDIGLKDGGPSAVVWMFLVVWAGAASIYACLCELSSMAPTAGGQYHWVSMLAPTKYRKFLSYITGWLTVIGWQANLASSFYISASMVQGAVIMLKPDFPKVPWQTVLIYWAILLWSLFVNAVVSKLLPAFESLILIIHIIGIPAILIPIVYLAPHADPSAVFQNFTNEGNLYTEGLAVMVGVLGNVYTYTGGDAAVHMAEEIRGASVVVPRAILTSVFINGALAFGMLIAFMFSITDLESLANPKTGWAFMDICLDVAGPSGGTALVAIILVMQFACSLSIMAATSRMTWSFARDRGLPLWGWVAKVDPRTSIPLASVLLCTIISVLLSLIILGSSTVFNNLVSISVNGLYTSYFISTGLLLWRRLAGHIQDEKRFEGEVINTAGAPLVWGPWKLPKYIDIPINAFGCAWALIVMFFSLWPPVIPVTPANMQYSVVVVAGVTIAAILYYIAFGRRHYDGPIIEDDAKKTRSNVSS